MLSQVRDLIQAIKIYDGPRPYLCYPRKKKIIMGTKKVAAITGTGSGIGRALAKELGRKGFQLALTNINELALTETVADLDIDRKDFLTKATNVANRTEVNEFAEATISKSSGVDVLINNAGVTAIDKFDTMPEEDFDWVMSVNFTGMVNGCRAFIPSLLKGTNPSLINISSVLAVAAYPDQAAYNASKLATRGFTESIAQ